MFVQHWKILNFHDIKWKLFNTIFLNILRPVNFYYNIDQSFENVLSTEEIRKKKLFVSLDLFVSLNQTNPA